MPRRCGDLDVPVVFNVDATPRQRAGEVRAALKRQMASAVRWEETMLLLRQDGVTVAVEVGPRNVLAGLMKRTVPGDCDPGHRPAGRHRVVA